MSTVITPNAYIALTQFDWITFILNFNRLFVNDSKKYSAYSEA